MHLVLVSLDDYIHDRLAVLREIVHFQCAEHFTVSAADITSHKLTGLGGVNPCQRLTLLLCGHFLLILISLLFLLIFGDHLYLRLALFLNVDLGLLLFLDIDLGLVRFTDLNFRFALFDRDFGFLLLDLSIKDLGQPRLRDAMVEARAADVGLNSEGSVMIKVIEINS